MVLASHQTLTRNESNHSQLQVWSFQHARNLHRHQCAPGQSASLLLTPYSYIPSMGKGHIPFIFSGLIASTSVWGVTTVPGNLRGCMGELNASTTFWGTTRWRRYLAYLFQFEFCDIKTVLSGVEDIFSSRREQRACGRLVVGIQMDLLFSGMK